MAFSNKYIQLREQLLVYIFQELGCNPPAVRVEDEIPSNDLVSGVGSRVGAFRLVG